MTMARPVMIKSGFPRSIPSGGIRREGFQADRRLRRRARTKEWPELTFGITMQQHVGEPILLIKILGAAKPEHGFPVAERNGFGNPVQRQQIENFKKRNKDVAAERKARAERTGVYYRLMLEHIRKVLVDIQRVYPAYDAKAGYELAGFVWPFRDGDMVDGDTSHARTAGQLRCVQQKSRALHSRCAQWMFEASSRRASPLPDVDVGESDRQPERPGDVCGIHASTSRGETRPEPSGLVTARSRGGLMPNSDRRGKMKTRDKVACITGIYPVCNIASYPGLQRASGAFGLTAQGLEAQLANRRTIPSTASRPWLRRRCRSFTSTATWTAWCRWIKTPRSSRTAMTSSVDR